MHSQAATKAQHTTPDDWRRDPKKCFELETRLLAFVATSKGAWTQKAHTRYRKLVENRGFALTENEFNRRLARAVKQFRTGGAHLFLCVARPCCDNLGFDYSEIGLERLSREIGLRISPTMCQFRCCECPIVTLRVGDRSQMFAEFDRPENWTAVVEYAKRSCVAGALLHDAAAAAPFRFEPPPPRKN